MERATVPDERAPMTGETFFTSGLEVELAAAEFD